MEAGTTIGMQRRGAVLDDTKPVWRTMLTFLIPLALSNILQALGGTFVSIFLGRLIGVQALAAASAVFPMIFFLISFFFGVSSGSTVLIGQAYGARDEVRLGRTAGTTITFALALGVAIGVLGLFLDRPLLAAIGTPADIFDDAAAYARVSFITLPLTFIFYGYISFLRGTGDVRTPFVLLCATTAAGIVLGFFLIGHLGVVGSPVATAITMALGITGLLVWLERGDSPFALSRVWRYLGVDWPLLGSLIRIGVPTGVQFVMASLAEIAVISFVNGFGFRATAAYGAVNQVVSYVQFPAISIGIAGSIFGAQAIGAGRLDRLPKIVRAAVTLNYVIGGVLIGIAYLLSHELLSLFITDPSTLAIAQGLLHITLWSYVIFGNSAVLSGLMRSSGSVLWPTTISILSIWLVEVPTAWVLSRGPLGLSGVWYAYPVTYFTSLTCQSIYYFFFWRRRPIKALHEKPAAASA